MVSRKILAMIVAIMIATVAVAGVVYAAYSANYMNTGNSVDETHATIYVSGDQAIFSKDVTYNSTTTISNGSPVSTFVFSEDMAVTADKKAMLSSDNLQLIVTSTDADAEYTLSITFSSALTALGEKANYVIDLTNTSSNTMITSTINGGDTFTFENNITAGTYSMVVYVLLADDFVSFSSDQLIADMTSGSVTFTATVAEASSE